MIVECALGVMEVALLVAGHWLLTAHAALMVSHGYRTGASPSAILAIITYL